jgi:hypothetical protein
MATRTLTEKIEALPAEKKAEVEDFVEFLASRTARLGRIGQTGPSLVERLRAQREELLREHGLFDTLPFIREFRETSGR